MIGLGVFFLVVLVVASWRGPNAILWPNSSEEAGLVVVTAGLLAALPVWVIEYVTR